MATINTNYNLAVPNGTAFLISETRGVTMIKIFLMSFGAKNKYEISKKIAEAYPQLNSKLPEKRKAWETENYYQGIFDAMALILTHYYLND